MKNEEKLKVISWNIAKKSNDSIVDEIKGQNADVIILSELPTNPYERILNKIVECDKNFFDPIIDRGINESCGLSIIVSRKKIKSVECINLDWNEQTAHSIFHPDALLVNVKLKNGASFNILGTRLKGNLNRIKRADAVEQILAFISIIERFKPQIVIGDLNWYGVVENKKAIEYAISDKIEIQNYKVLREKLKKYNVEYVNGGVKKIDNLEKTFLDIINELTCDKNMPEYKMWPLNSDGLYSFIAKRGHGKSSPDRAIFRGDWAFSYYPKVEYENAAFPEGWASDHAMLTASSKIKQ
jgi:hypothetical protein